MLFIATPIGYFSSSFPFTPVEKFYFPVILFVVGKQEIWFFASYLIRTKVWILVFFYLLEMLTLCEIICLFFSKTAKIYSSQSWLLYIGSSQSLESFLDFMYFSFLELPLFCYFGRSG